MSLAELRRKIVRAAFVAGEGHIPSAFSILEIVQALYSGGMEPEDRFVLSKGHGCLALYAVLADKGVIDWRDFESYASLGHPDAARIPGVEFSTGSLGHGLALGAGLALGKFINGEPGRVFVLVGDGECQEGATWEAAGVIGELWLNVIVIVDGNGSHLDNEMLKAQFASHGIPRQALEGHRPAELVKAFKEVRGPFAYICKTVKGHGSETFEDDPEAWHHRTPKPDELEAILGEIR